MKKISDILRIEIEAGKASPSPPVGPGLGLRGVNIMSFCKEFNGKSQSYKNGVPLPTIITIYEDKSFDIEIKNPSSMKCFLSILELDRGYSNRVTSIKIIDKIVYEISRIKKLDKGMECISEKSICKSLLGTAKSMGVRLRRSKV